MRGTVQFAIEGPEAEVALKELLAMPGLEGRDGTERDACATRDGGALAAVGVLVGITSGIVTAVDKIIAWREKWQKREGCKKLNVVVEDAKGGRLMLENASPEEIAAVLATMTLGPSQ